MCAVAAAKGDVTLKNVIPRHLEAISSKLEEIGVTVIESEDGTEVRVVSDENARLGASTVRTRVYPGFPTDMQPQITVVLMLGDGDSTVYETIFENRFRYVDELVKMGAEIKVKNNETAKIHGVQAVHGAHIDVPDLRAGAALTIAALAADGQTVMDWIDYIERGYEDFDGKLRGIGADIVKEAVNDIKEA